MKEMESLPCTLPALEPLKVCSRRGVGREGKGVSEWSTYRRGSSR